MSTTILRPMERLITAVADEEGVDPVELSPPLAETIDPDALDALLDRADPSSQLEVRFTYWEHEIVARANGDVDIQ